jgi:hypothetical protein
MIAGTVLEHGLTVVTRNVSDFEPTGVPVLNPFNPRDPFGCLRIKTDAIGHPALLAKSKRHFGGSRIIGREQPSLRSTPVFFD